MKNIITYSIVGCLMCLTINIAIAQEADTILRNCDINTSMYNVKKVVKQSNGEYRFWGKDYHKESLMCWEVVDSTRSIDSTVFHLDTTINQKNCVLKFWACGCDCFSDSEHGGIFSPYLLKVESISNGLDTIIDMTSCNCDDDEPQYYGRYYLKDYNNDGYPELVTLYRHTNGKIFFFNPIKKIYDYKNDFVGYPKLIDAKLNLWFGTDNRPNGANDHSELFTIKGHEINKLYNFEFIFNCGKYVGRYNLIILSKYNKKGKDSFVRKIYYKIENDDKDCYKFWKIHYKELLGINK